MDRAFFVCIKDFNKPINLRNILPNVTNKWECCVHSYLIGTVESRLYALHCNIISSDRNLKTPTLLVISSAIDTINYVEYLRWKSIIISDVINFELSIIDDLGNKVDATVNSFTLLIFRRKNEV